MEVPILTNAQARDGRVQTGSREKAGGVRTRHRLAGGRDQEAVVSEGGKLPGAGQGSQEIDLVQALMNHLDPASVLLDSLRKSWQRTIEKAFKISKIKIK